jgi:hypothetical protein
MLNVQLTNYSSFAVEDQCLNDNLYVYYDGCNEVQCDCGQNANCTTITTTLPLKPTTDECKIKATSAKAALTKECCEKVEEELEQKTE